VGAAGRVGQPHAYALPVLSRWNSRAGDMRKPMHMPHPNPPLPPPLIEAGKAAHLSWHTKLRHTTEGFDMKHTVTMPCRLPSSGELEGKRGCKRGCIATDQLRAARVLGWWPQWHYHSQLGEIAAGPRLPCDCPRDCTEEGLSRHGPHLGHRLVARVAPIMGTGPSTSLFPNSYPRGWLRPPGAPPLAPTPGVGARGHSVRVVQPCGRRYALPKLERCSGASRVTGGATHTNSPDWLWQSWLAA